MNLGCDHGAEKSDINELGISLEISRMAPFPDYPTEQELARMISGYVIDPHMRRWMQFVDGENFTIRAENLAKKKNIRLEEGNFYLRDVFVWIPKWKATQAPIADIPVPLQPHAIRSYYYTSVVGDTDKLLEVRQYLWNLGFHPEVFKKEGGRSKGVDITLAKDMLWHAFFNHYDAALLIAGDGDYIPLVNDLKRLGKVIYVAFFAELPESGLNQNLPLASDRFLQIDDFFFERWQHLNDGASGSV